MNKYAFVTLLDNDSYIYSVIALYSSWLKTNSKYPFYCACTKNVPIEILKNLRELGIKQISLADIKGLDRLKNKLQESGYNSWVPALQKLAIYGLIQFDKIVFLDADTYVFKNLDHLFNCPHLTAVADGEGRDVKEDKFVSGDHYFKKLNAGMVVIEPSEKLFKDIIAFTQNVEVDRPWADQMIVSELYPNWEFEKEKHLPVYYNCLGRHINEYEKNIKDFSIDKIYVLHLVGPKMSPHTTFEKLFNSSQSWKYNTYFELLKNICEDVNNFITEKKKLKLLINLEKVRVPYHIDLVVPYVDSSDPNWRVLFEKYNPYSQKIEGINAPNRFRGQGDFFKYFFEGVKKYTPWINKIFLIVQSYSQIPSWINEYQNVEIVYHRDFIPQEFLPTFNSACIEMFVPFIKGLSEKFLYANDDMFFFNKIEKSDFFGENNIIYKTAYPYQMKKELTMYDNHCLNNFSCVFEKDKNNITTYWAMHHEIRPYIKSKCIECFERYKDEIYTSISRFREEKNFNMYLYDLYDIKNHIVVKSTINFRTVFNYTDDKLRDAILKTPQVLCIEDIMTTYGNIYEGKFLNACFYNHYFKNIDPTEERIPKSGEKITRNQEQGLPNIDDWTSLMKSKK